MFNIYYQLQPGKFFLPSDKKRAIPSGMALFLFTIRKWVLIFTE